MPPVAPVSYCFILYFYFYFSLFCFPFDEGGGIANDMYNNDGGKGGAYAYEADEAK